ncbi:MAG: DUF1441 family protein [Rhodocyclaceae bacterium]|nr:DUF1441 family protein [Rhodocyclaceae bacterium]
MTHEPVSLNWLHQTTGLPFSRVSEALAEANVQPADSKAGHARYLLESALPAIIGALQSPSDPALMSPRARKDHFQAARVELALRRERAELLPIAAFEQGAARAHAMVREALDSLPDNLERKAGLNPAGVVLARDVVDAALQDLCDQLQAAYLAAKKCTSEEFAATGRRLIEEDIADLL